MTLTLSSITKTYSNNTVVADISCEVSNGEFVTFLGPSGSGKSTLLNIIAGVVFPTAGRIYFDDVDITDTEPGERNIGFVFQNYALYPNMTVRKNIEFPLEVKGIPKSERKHRADRIAEMVKISPLMEKRPKELSGGEQQRVAIARALVKEPQLLLLDEPFSNVDPRLSLLMREEIRNLQRSLGITTILVTHNQAEAMELSDRIAILSQGKLQQIGNPRNVYSSPKNLFCANFIGDVVVNSIKGKVVDNSFYSDDGKIIINGIASQNGELTLCIRPESTVITSSEKSSIKGIIQSIVDTGREYIVILAVGCNTIKCYYSFDFPILNVGDSCFIRFNNDGIMFFDRDGEKIEFE